MKLHLTKSLRAALLACVCSSFAFTQAMAADEAVTNGGSLTIDEDRGDGTGTDWTILLDSQGTASAVRATLIVEGDNVYSVQAVREKFYGTRTNNEDSSFDLTVTHPTTSTLVKDGTGTLVINGRNTWGSAQNDGSKSTVYQLDHVVVDAGTLKINYGGSDGFARESVTVNGGATLHLAGEDALGYGGTWSGDYTDTLTLAGSKTGEGESAVTETATLVVDAHQTLTTNLVLNGYTEVKSNTVTSEDAEGNQTTTLLGDLDAFGGTITATGTNNLISTKLMVRNELKVKVTNTGDALTISGEIADNSKSGNSNDFVKTGAGTLTLASTAQVADTVDLIVDEGTLKVEGTETDRAYILRGGTLELTKECHIGTTDGASTKKITLAAETSGTTSENTIKGNGAAVFNDITGTGNLTLTDNVNIYADMDFTGNLTVKSGTYHFGNSGYGVSPTIANSGTVTIEKGATVTLDARPTPTATEENPNPTEIAPAKLQNGGDITVNGTLTVNKATVGAEGATNTIYVTGESALMQVNSKATINSAISVSDGGTVDVGTSPTFASSITVGDGGTLDVKDTQTLNTDALTLDAGSTLVMGSSTLDMSDTLTTKLTVEEGAIINLGAWNTDVYHYARETVLFTGVDEISWTGDSVAVWIDFGDGNLWQNWLIYDAENKRVYSIPEPATATLSLLALAGLCARRRRK